MADDDPQVMGHLAGIRHYKGGPDDLEIGNTKHFDDPIQGGLNFFKNEPLLSEPGTTFHYSTQGYTLVGCVMEGAAGTKYIDYMMQNVFAPAGMEHTVVDNRFAIIPLSNPLLSKDRGGARRERRISGLELQGSRRRMAFVGGRYGAVRSRDPQ